MLLIPWLTWGLMGIMTKMHPRSIWDQSTRPPWHHLAGGDDPIWPLRHQKNDLAAPSLHGSSTGLPNLHGSSTGPPSLHDSNTGPPSLHDSNTERFRGFLGFLWIVYTSPQLPFFQMQWARNGVWWQETRRNRRNRDYKRPDRVPVLK